MVIINNNYYNLFGQKEYPYLCFTANTASSTIQLKKTGSPTSVTLETSTDGENWSTYTIGSTITLANIGDKVYWRNTSETTTNFSTSGSAYYQFVMTGSISSDGDITYLLNKNGTNTVPDNAFHYLFYQCTSLTIAPKLNATTVGENSYNCMFGYCTSLTKAPALPATIIGQLCYSSMFQSCTSLETLPELPATTLSKACYLSMFNDCSKIKLSTTQTGEYQKAYRIPKTGIGTNATNALLNMFTYTGGTFKSTPSINTTYYTSNTVV